MTHHLVRLAAVTAAACLGVVAPFLPGKHDGLAQPLSTAVQLTGAAGLLLVPVGSVWLTSELIRRARRHRDPGHSMRGYYFAAVSLTAASVLMALVGLVVLFGVSAALGVGILAGWGYLVARWIPPLWRLKTAEAEPIPA